MTCDPPRPPGFASSRCVLESGACRDTDGVANVDAAVQLSRLHGGRLMSRLVFLSLTSIRSILSFSAAVTFW